MLSHSPCSHSVTRPSRSHAMTPQGVAQATARMGLARPRAVWQEEGSLHSPAPEPNSSIDNVPACRGGNPLSEPTATACTQHWATPSSAAAQREHCNTLQSHMQLLTVPFLPPVPARPGKSALTSRSREVVFTPKHFMSLVSVCSTEFLPAPSSPLPQNSITIC